MELFAGKSFMLMFSFSFFLVFFFRMLDSILTGEVEAMRAIARRIREAQKNHDDALKQRTIREYDATLERYRGSE